MIKRPLLYILFISLCSIIAACSGSGGTSGSSAVTISVSRGSGAAGSGSPTLFKAPAAVSSLVFTISASDMATITRTATIAAAQTVTEIFDVPNGTGRLFLVEAKDAGGTALYQGSETVDLAGTAVTLNITMNPVSSGLTPVTITTTLTGQAGTGAGGIASVFFTISAPDMEIPITRTVAIPASLTLTEAFEVPNGTARVFSVEARDAGGRAVARGSTSADLTGAALTLDIPLSPIVFAGTRLLGTALDDFGMAGARDSSGNNYIAGITHGDFNNALSTGATVTGNAFFSKFSQFGEPLFSRQFGTASGTFAFSMAVDGSGNIVVAGGTGGNLDGEANQGFTDGFVSKFDSSGSRLWTRLIGDASDDFVNAVAVDASGNVYVTGVIGSITVAGSSEVFIAKFDPSGTLQNIGFNTQSIIRYGATTSTNSGEAIALDANGNVYVAGFTDGNLDGNQNKGMKDIFISKIDLLGIKVTVQLGTLEDDQAAAVATDSSGMVYIGGATSGNLEGQVNADPDGIKSDMFVAKFNPTTASVLFAKLFGTIENDVVNEIAIDAAGNVLLAGSTNGSFAGNTNAGGSDSVVVKVSAAGEMTWARQIGTSNDDDANAVLVDAAGNAIVAGTTKGLFDGIQSSGFDVFLLMYDANGVKQ